MGRPKEGITVAPTQFKRKQRKDGRIPVYIRITKNRKHRYKATGIAVREKDWDSKNKIIKRSHKFSLELNKQLQTMLKMFEGRCRSLLHEKDPTLDELKEVLADVVDEYKTQPDSVYQSKGKSLEVAKRIVAELKQRGFVAEQFFFNQMRVIVYTKEYELEGEDFAEISDSKFLYKEHLVDLYDNSTLLNDLINEIEQEAKLEMKAFLEQMETLTKDLRDL